jgi:polyisoprenyl-teichoic acid--peptidoglycan teichoic acid transferase
VDQLPRCNPEAAADDDELGREDIREGADRDAEVVADAVRLRPRCRVTRERLGDESPRVRSRAPQPDRDSLGGLSGDEPLEMAAAVAVPLARRAVCVYDDVPELRPAAIQVPVEHDTAAHSRAEPEHDQVARSPAGAEAPFGERHRVAVVLDPDRERESRAQVTREIERLERQVHRTVRDPGLAIDVHRDTDADRLCPVCEQAFDGRFELGKEWLLPVGRRRDLRHSPDRTVARDRPGEDLRPADVDSDDSVGRHRAATIPGLMPAQDKPYRVYRGGRVKGRVPLTRTTQAPSRRDGRTRATPGAEPHRPRRRKRWIALGLVLLFALLVVWGVAGYLAVAGGVSEAGDRVPAGVRRQLAETDGLLVSTPTTILVLGTDGGSRPGREGANRSDSIMLIRTDPGKRRLAFLSIPRDLQVEIPEVGVAKINAANQIGGPALALRTVRQLTGLDVNHVAFVDFDRFEELIDAVGGIDVDIARPIRSNRFDCPYATAQRCAQWPGWRFERGRQHMDGRRALVYSRIRRNLLDPGETDFARARRQQQVVEATLDKVTSVGSALRLPFIGDDLVAPLATDLSAWQLMQLGWVYFRADTGRALHCRLGGDPATVGGESVILGTEDNVATVAMFTGRSAPLPPPRGLPYAPGCLVGQRRA